MKIIKPKAFHFFKDGAIEGLNVERYEKTFAEVVNLYQNREKAQELGDTIAYTVYSYEEGNQLQKGNLNWGLTILPPIVIDGECNMTRGHFHEDKNCAEFYCGITGEGLLLLMDADGVTWAEEVSAGSLHHIDGQHAHRLINTGQSDLKVGACWSVTAGHDYVAIENKNFGYRVFNENGAIISKERKK